jgi:hypothetical protein
VSKLEVPDGRWQLFEVPFTIFAQQVLDAIKHCLPVQQRSIVHALRIIFEPGLDVDAIGPDVDIPLGRQVAIAPAGVLVDPISTGDFEDALAALLGKDAGGLSASTIK